MGSSSSLSVVLYLNTVRFWDADREGISHVGHSILDFHLVFLPSVIWSLRFTLGLLLYIPTSVFCHSIKTSETTAGAFARWDHGWSGRGDQDGPAWFLQGRVRAGTQVLVCSELLPPRITRNARSLATEGSYHRVRHPYIWRTRDVGYRLCVHPRRRAEKVREILRHRGAKERQELAVGSRVVAEVRDQTSEEGTPTTSWDPGQAFLAVRCFSFPFVTPHGLLPLMVSQLVLHHCLLLFCCHSYRIVAVEFNMCPLHGPCRHQSIYSRQHRNKSLVRLVLRWWAVGDMTWCPARSSSSLVTALLAVYENLMP